MEIATTTYNLNCICDRMIPETLSNYKMIKDFNHKDVDIIISYNTTYEGVADVSSKLYGDLIISRCVYFTY